MMALYTETYNNAPTVVTYMNIPGQKAQLYGLACCASQMEISSSAMPANSWFDPPKSTHSHCQKPKTIKNKVSRTAMIEPTCAFLKAGILSPKSSALATRMKRNTNCITVNAMTVRKTAPIAPPSAAGMPTTLRKRAMPPENTLAAPIDRK